MAPESERAMYPLCTDVLRDQGKPYPRTCAECQLGPCKRKLTAPNPNDPTLTCSEVVERLYAECAYTNQFDRKKALVILHSWRERRVQELERLLDEAILFIETTAMIGRGVPTLKSLPPYSEWREQIRKGAKHE